MSARSVKSTISTLSCGATYTCIDASEKFELSIGEAYSGRATIAELVAQHSNDYSRFEPFCDDTPLSTSVVIPVFRHAQLLAFQLQRWSCINDSDLTGVELLIVSDGSPDIADIRKVVSAHRSGIDIKLIDSPVNRGAAAARNLGLHEAKNDLIVFLDSDVLLPRGYFSCAWHIHNALPNAISVGFAHNLDAKDGLVKALVAGADLKPDIRTDFRYSNDSIYRIAKLPSGTERLVEETDWFKKFSHGATPLGWTLPEMVVGHNMAVRRENALSIGGFDERFVSYGSEDTFFGAALIAKGNYVIPLRDSGVFRVRHAPRHGDEERILRSSLRAAIEYNQRLNEPPR